MKIVAILACQPVQQFITKNPLLFIKNWLSCYKYIHLNPLRFPVWNYSPIPPKIPRNNSIVVNIFGINLQKAFFIPDTYEKQAGRPAVQSRHSGRSVTVVTKAAGEKTPAAYTFSTYSVTCWLHRRRRTRRRSRLLLRSRRHRGRQSLHRQRIRRRPSRRGHQIHRHPGRRAACFCGSWQSPE
jgi:hypothetical protein